MGSILKKKKKYQILILQIIIVTIFKFLKNVHSIRIHPHMKYQVYKS